MATIWPLAQTFKLVNKEGFYTTSFKQYLDLVLARIGGVTGGIYNKLTYQDSLVWNLDQDPIAVLVLTGSPTITVANQVAGNLYPYRLTLVQDATGGRTVTWGSMFKWPSGMAPTLSTAANAVDELWFVSDGTNMKGLVFGKDIR